MKRQISVRSNGETLLLGAILQNDLNSPITIFRQNLNENLKKKQRRETPKLVTLWKDKDTLLKRFLKMSAPSAISLDVKKYFKVF